MRIVDVKEENAALFLDYLGADLAENLERSLYRCVVAENDHNEPVAGMMWKMSRPDEEAPAESRIVWISIEDEEAGEALLKAYEKRVSEEGAVLSTLSVYTKRNGPENRLLKEHGFSVRITEGDTIILILSELLEMPTLKSKKPSDKVKPLGAASVHAYRSFISRLIAKGKTRLCEDIRTLPMSWFEKRVSCCWEDEEDVSGMLLFHRDPSGSLTLKLMSVLGKDKKEMGQKLLLMMRQAVATAGKLYPPDTRVIVERYNEAALLLAERLFPRGFGRPVYVGKRIEEPARGQREADDMVLFKMT